MERLGKLPLEQLTPEVVVPAGFAVGYLSELPRCVRVPPCSRPGTTLLGVEMVLCLSDLRPRQLETALSKP